MRAGAGGALSHSPSLEGRGWGIGVALLALLLLALPAHAQLLEQVLNPDFTLATQAAPTVEVLPARGAHAAQPESLGALERDAVRINYQFDDLIRLRSAKQNVTVQVHRAAATYFTKLPNGALSIELPAGSGDEGRTTKNTQHTASHNTSGLRMAWTGTSAGLRYGLQLADTASDINGQTTAMRQFLNSKTARPFAIPATNRQATATVGSDLPGGGGTVRLGYRSLAVPATLYGTTNAVKLDFRGAGPALEARRWWEKDGRTMGVLLGGQSASGRGGTFYNTARQGDTRAGFSSLSLAGAYRRPHRGGVVTMQLTHQVMRATGDANFFYPTDNDFVDFLGGTGIAKSWARFTATSVHVGVERLRGATTLRAGYQGVLLNGEAGFDYHTQYLGGGVRNESSEVIRLNNATLHILGGGIERRFSWGKIGYGLMLTVPLGIDLQKTDLIDHPEARSAAGASSTAAIASSAKGGMAHAVVVEMAL